MRVVTQPKVYSTPSPTPVAYVIPTDHTPHGSVKPTRRRNYCSNQQIDFLFLFQYQTFNNDRNSTTTSYILLSGIYDVLNYTILLLFSVRFLEETYSLLRSGPQLKTEDKRFTQSPQGTGYLFSNKLYRLSTINSALEEYLCLFCALFRIFYFKNNNSNTFRTILCAPNILLLID